ncbi:hypothetical protein EV294_11256 [Paenibacillus sp. BK033]|uniref:hypothetical protein n=1 Tax=Paenibacillus sp. BK033 TaxID=2512133 RepID=UPI00104A443E|nr:hypothetical protein [Paenibacillus sp. BK033]TCM89591.1 hypothetical protein EV294_11256 [Paenibacillus sp. BK033]
MAYTKTDWKDNETPISAANMNKIENGIAGAHTTIDEATSAATPDTIARRDANGRMKAAAPVESDDVALKSTVDTHAAITTAPVHGSTSAATPNTLAHRDANGQFSVGAPTADTHAATKAYVDAQDALKGIVSGTYTGNGAAGFRTISTGIDPKLIYVTGQTDINNSIAVLGMVNAVTVLGLSNSGGSAGIGPFQSSSNGPNPSTGGFTVQGGLNISGRVYYYTVIY